MPTCIIHQHVLSVDVQAIIQYPDLLRDHQLDRRAFVHGEQIAVSLDPALTASCSWHWLGLFSLTNPAAATVLSWWDWLVSYSLMLKSSVQVLMWNGLASGDPKYCAILVTANSVMQMALYAPLAVLFVRIIDRSNSVQVSYGAVATSVGVFLGIPLGAAILTRAALCTIDRRWYEQVFLELLAPWSLIGLLYTIVVLFALQGRQVVHQIVSVVRVAALVIIYFAVIFLCHPFDSE
ncbi:hypothetical protein ANO11243_018400 [Dothideomycetidae sp. 11243]|nr:hypothetical protein ANO11243_018400 [fungal sp. No.11243]